MEEKIDLLLKEFQEVKLWLDRVKKQLNEEVTNDHRSRETIIMREGMEVPIGTRMTMITSHVGPKLKLPHLTTSMLLGFHSLVSWYGLLF